MLSGCMVIPEMLTSDHDCGLIKHVSRALDVSKSPKANSQRMPRKLYVEQRVAIRSELEEGSTQQEQERNFSRRA